MTGKKAFNPLADCVIKIQSASLLTHAIVINNKKFWRCLCPVNKSLHCGAGCHWWIAVLHGKLDYFLGHPHPNPLFVCGSESFYLLLNFENDNMGLSVKMFFCWRTDSASFHFSPSFFPSSSSLSPLAPITD